MSTTIKIPIIFNKENSLKYNQDQIKEYILNNYKNNDFPIYGEIVHNDNRISLNINNITHKINHVSLVDNKLIADTEILDIPMGKIIPAVINADLPLKLFPRIIVDYNDKNNPQLISIDIGISKN